MKPNKFKISQTYLLMGVLAVWLAVKPAISVCQTPPDGKYRAYYSNHNLKESGYFTAGQKDKRWSYYNEKGVIERKEKWNNGELLWQIFYNNKGKITKTIDKDGKEKVRPACGC